MELRYHAASIFNHPRRLAKCLILARSAVAPYVWDGIRCVNKFCRFGATAKPLRPPEPPKKIRPVFPASFDIRWQSASLMGDAAIARLLKKLKRTECGWRVTLPKKFGNFLGVQLYIDIQTRQVPEQRTPPEVNEVEMLLAKSILLRLRDVLLKAEQSFEEYNSNDSDAMGLVWKPHIWIDRDELEEKGANRWAFVVNTKGDSAYGWHIEFKGTKFREIWAGD